MPPAIIRDFLAQLGEMLDRVERDVERLGASPRDGGVKDRISGALSAIGTGAGFLHLSGLVLATASATGALQRLQGTTPDADASALEDLRKAIGAMRVRQAELGKALSAGAPTRPTVQMPAPEPERPAPPGVERRALRLDDSKTPLVEFMVDDLRDAIALIEQAVDRLDAPAPRSAGARELERIGVELSRTAKFFELDGLRLLAEALRGVGQSAERMSDGTLAQVLPRVRAVLELLRELTDNLGYSTVMVRPVERLCGLLADLAAGREMDPASLLPEGCTAMAALEHDGVIAPSEPAPRAEAGDDFRTPDELVANPASVVEQATRAASVPGADAGAAEAIELANELAAEIQPQHLPEVAARAEQTAPGEVSIEEQSEVAEAETPVVAEPAIDETTCEPVAVAPAIPAIPAIPAMPEMPSAPATIGPEPKRLDAAIAELGNLITQSSRLAAIPEELAPARESTRLATRVAHISDDVTRATIDVKAAVLDARAVPLRALFVPCEDAVRLAMRRTDATVAVTTRGGEIEIDMGVIDRLRDPLRELAGASVGEMRADGEIALAATVDESTAMMELTIVLALRAGASLAQASVNELRGAVEAIRGTMVVQTDETGDATIRMRVPTNLAFIHCTVVRIGGTLAAIPMAGVDQVVKPEADQIVGGQTGRAVLVREGAAELLDGHALFGDATESKGTMPYAVVVSHEGKRVALSCTRAVGAQEIVVRPMDPMPRRLGPITGVGASSSGAAALIVDVPALVRMASDRSGRLGLAA